MAPSTWSAEQSAGFGMRPRSRWLVHFAVWGLTHRRVQAMSWYNRLFLPLGLLLQRAPGVGAGPDRRREGGRAFARLPECQRLSPRRTTNRGRVLGPARASGRDDRIEVAASSAQAGQRRRAQTDGPRPGEDTEHREGRIELEPARGNIQPAGGAVMVVLEQLAEGEEVQR